MKLELKLTNDWLEATWYNEEVTINEETKEETVTKTQVHCESFSGHKEHIAMLRSKAKEFGTKLDEALISECMANFKMPTDEELLVEANKAKVQEARAYLISTAWYIERLNDPSSGKAVPQEVLDKRAEARVLINELEG